MPPTTDRDGSPSLDVMAVIAKIVPGIPVNMRGTVIARDSRLVEDLALDSLDLLAVFCRLEEIYQIEFLADEVSMIRTIGDLAARLDDHIRARPSPP